MRAPPFAALCSPSSWSWRRPRAPSRSRFGMTRSASPGRHCGSRFRRSCWSFCHSCCAGDFRSLRRRPSGSSPRRSLSWTAVSWSFRPAPSSRAWPRRSSWAISSTGFRRESAWWSCSRRRRSSRTTIRRALPASTSSSPYSAPSPGRWGSHYDRERKRRGLPKPAPHVRSASGRRLRAWRSQRSALESPVSCTTSSRTR